MLWADVDLWWRRLEFKQPAGTSRGTYTTRIVWHIVLTDPSDPSHVGVGECAPLFDLGAEDLDLFSGALPTAAKMLARDMTVPYDEFIDYPSVIFGMETALLSYKRRSYRLFDTPFCRGEDEIPINGLVWMGSYDEMLARMQEKLDKGFRCIKLKIGAIDFDKELELMRIIRSAYPASKVQLRVDANGAFSPQDALSRLDALSKFDIHSIEQPIWKGQWAKLDNICKSSPIPIALDEELIGANRTWQKEQLLDAVHPQYLVLKPTLHGGMRGTREWVDMARDRGIGSWITSALESNVGLNAVAQLASDIYGPNISMPQGLGTGQLFVKNTDLPFRLELRGDRMRIAE